MMAKLKRRATTQAKPGGLRRKRQGRGDVVTLLLHACHEPWQRDRKAGIWRACDCLSTRTPMAMEHDANVPAWADELRHHQYGKIAKSLHRSLLNSRTSYARVGRGRVI